MGDDPDDKYDSKQLERGIEVQKEHIDNPVAEIPDYYTRLDDKMESEAGIKN